jgi:PAS domain S-box-containing protein
MTRPAAAVLHLEDSDLDAAFVRDRLAHAGLAVAVDRASDRAGFVAMLRSRPYDLILSDYRVPTFEGLEALDLARECQPDTPFIIVSGAMGEEAAVESLKRGATDYILKERLTRLPAACERAIADARERAERRKAEADLRASEERFRLVLANVADHAIFTLDLAGNVLDWNPGAERLFGYPAADAVGRPGAIVYTPEDRVAGRPEREMALCRREGRAGNDRWHVRRDGTQFYASGSMEAVRHPDGSLLGYVTVVRDRTAEVRSKALVDGQKRALELSAAGAPLAAVLDVLVRTAEAQSDGGVLASVLLLDDDGRHLRHGAAPSLPDEYNRGVDGIAVGPAVGSCGTAAFTGREVVVTDVAADPRWAEFRGLALAHGLRACWSTPIRSSAGYVLGTFALYYREPKAPPEADREVVGLLSNTAAVLIERDRAARDRRRAEEELARAAAAERHRAGLLARVAAASRAVNAVLSVDGIARIVTEEARAIVGAHQGVTTLTAGGDGSQAISAASYSDKYAEYRTHPEPPDGTGIYAEVCRRNRPMRLTQAELERHPLWRGFGRHAADRPPVRGWLAVPLVGHGGSNLGVIQLSDKYDGEFTAEDEAVLVQLAAIAAVGIENARLYESLREASQRKDEFLATLAHELRNPLAPIQNGLHVLRLRHGADVAEPVGMMERQLRHLVHLVDDLLDVSRVTSGKITLRPERLDLRDVVASALETSRPLADAARHRVEVRLPDEPLPVDGDKTRLAQVLTNVLTNACKYTPEGGRIEVSAEADGESVAVRVADTGVGIPRDMLPKVFDVFTQVGRSIDRSQGGLGLGLALVRKLVEMHGGSVRADSPGPGQGSTFVVRLPLARGADGRSTPAAGPAGDPAAPPPAGS